MKFKILIILSIIAVSGHSGFTQVDDLLSLLGEEESTEYTNASFKTNRVVNFHSLENTAPGVLDFKINHRFNTLDEGFYDLFGLDGASIRLAFDYGLSEKLQIGAARSSLGKTYDFYAKYKFLRQSTGKKEMPLTLALVAATDVTTLKFDQDVPFWDRFNYNYQLIIGRKFSESFSAELLPTIVHRNLVVDKSVKNDVFAMGVGLRQKVTKRVALNLEYSYVHDGQIQEQFHNAFSVGFDIETGGHVFQLHLTNARAMFERGVITESTSDWLDGQIHFGFNISRVFTLRERQ